MSITPPEWRGTILDIDGEYVEYLHGIGLQQASITIYARYIALAEHWLKDRGGLMDALPSDVVAWAEECVASSNSSRRQASVALNHWWQWKQRPAPPVKAVRVPPQPEMVCRAVDEDQARALVKTAVGWWPKGTVVLFGLYLALRRFEIAKAEWGRFSDDMKWYTVTGKFDKTDTIPVHQILRDELSAGGSGYVFKGRFGEHVTPATIWDWSKQVAAAAGIEHFTTHQLRHTALTTANDALGDLRAVQTFARHNKISSTVGYTRTKRTRLREVSDSLNYLD